MFDIRLDLKVASEGSAEAVGVTREAWVRGPKGVAQETTREPRGHALALGLKMWMVSPRASISTSWAMRLARVSAFTAVCMRHSTA